MSTELIRGIPLAFSNIVRRAQLPRKAFRMDGNFRSIHSGVTFTVHDEVQRLVVVALWRFVPKWLSPPSLVSAKIETSLLPHFKPPPCFEASTKYDLFGTLEQARIDFTGCPRFLGGRCHPTWSTAIGIIPCQEHVSFRQ